MIREMLMPDLMREVMALISSQGGLFFLGRAKTRSYELFSNSTSRNSTRCQAG
jgi:hypothetical protein